MSAILSTILSCFSRDQVKICHDRYMETVFADKGFYTPALLLKVVQIFRQSHALSPSLLIISNKYDYFNQPMGHYIA